MFGNNTININLIENHVIIQNDACGKRLYDKLCP